MNDRFKKQPEVWKKLSNRTELDQPTIMYVRRRNRSQTPKDCYIAWNGKKYIKISKI